MTCIVDTNSINLTVTLGQLSADLIVGPTAVEPGSGVGMPSPLAVIASGLTVIGSNGWIPLPYTLAFSSASAPTYVATTSGDMTGFLAPGMKLKVIQSLQYFYFEIVAITSTTITLYGGDTQVLANSAITFPAFSTGDHPYNFPRLTCSTIPSVAYNGMQIVYVPDATNGVEWKLTYTASEPSIKWRFNGGPPLIASVDASENVVTASGVFGAFPTPAQIIVPRSGEYMCRYGGEPGGNAGGTTSALGIFIGGSGLKQMNVNNSTQGGLTQVVRLTATIANAIDTRGMDGDSTRRIAWRVRTIELLPYRLL